MFVCDYAFEKCVTYGLKDTCFLCSTVGHRRDSCPKRKTRERKQEEKKQDKSANLHAAVVSGKQALPAEEVIPTDEKIIEVLDEEFIDMPSETDDMEQNELTLCGTKPASKEETRRQESLEKMKAAAFAIKEAFENETANIRASLFLRTRLLVLDSQPRRRFPVDL
ncbi:AAEL009215-PA [Aedes aegypti]|uniref:AAEL009215-PA n=1 Tax=Aedes aegypti TaxID=7159 RepID=Q16WI4_AEDAE|nr:AAEL009215-PA [Aedes aegypti]